MPIAPIISWSAVRPKNDTESFSGSIQVFTCEGAQELRRLRADDFAKYVSILRGTTNAVIDTDRRVILEGTYLAPQHA